MRIGQAVYVLRLRGRNVVVERGTIFEEVAAEDALSNTPSYFVVARDMSFGEEFDAHLVFTDSAEANRRRAGVERELHTVLSARSGV